MSHVISKKRNNVLENPVYWVIVFLYYQYSGFLSGKNVVFPEGGAGLRHKE